MCRQGRSGESPVARLEDVGHLLGSEPALPDLYQCSGNCPNHVLKESIAADREYPRRVRAMPRSFEDRSRTVLDLCRCCAERREIVCTEEVLAAFVQLLVIEGI